MKSLHDLIRTSSNHGKPCFLVDLLPSITGKGRVRRFFPTRLKAEEFARAFLADNRSLGQDANHWLHSLSTSQRTELVLGVEKLARLGFSPLQAASFLETQCRQPESVSLGDLVARFLSEKAARRCRPRYLGKLRATLGAFSANRQAQAASGISQEDVRAFVRGNGWAAATRKSYLGDLRAFFGWAIRRKLLQEDPSSAEEAPILDDKPPGVLPAAAVARVLEVCQRTDPGMLPFFAVGLFGGLRSQEALRLSASDILADFVEIKAAKAKTRQRRLVPISPQLRAWLNAGISAGADFPPPNWRLRWLAIREAAGLRQDWPANAARHSFVSYHFAKYGSASQTAAIAGHSEGMLFRHYRALVSPTEADAFFGLLPNPSAIAEGVVATQRRRDSANDRRGASVKAWNLRKREMTRAESSGSAASD
jgi:integrase